MTRVAEIIAPRHPEAGADELRSIALGWLARPAELLQLLLEGRDPQDQLAIAVEDPAAGDRFPGALRDALREIGPSPRATKAVLYVHLHEAALRGVPAPLPGSRDSAR